MLYVIVSWTDMYNYIFQDAEVYDGLTDAYGKYHMVTLREYSMINLTIQIPVHLGITHFRLRLK